MKKSTNFEKYVAAVEMATLESQGSGDLNKFDHVAKDLHTEEFELLYEELPQWQRNFYRSERESEVEGMAREKYEE